MSLSFQDNIITLGLIPLYYVCFFVSKWGQYIFCEKYLDKCLSSAMHQKYKVSSELSIQLLKNPAYGRHRICWTIWIEAPIWIKYAFWLIFFFLIKQKFGDIETTRPNRPSGLIRWKSRIRETKNFLSMRIVAPSLGSVNVQLGEGSLSVIRYTLLFLGLSESDPENPPCF